MTSDQKLFSKYKNSIKDNVAIVMSSKRGVAANVFFDLATISGINKNQLAEEIYGISLKTINRYKQEKKKLSPKNSELTLQLLALYMKGIEVFGDADSFSRWLNKKAFGLGNQVPYDLMSTSKGIDLIFEEIIRIEYGDLA